MPNPNGRVLYEGPSLIDGVPIVVIATGFADTSANGKTGAMLQTWILRQDIPPHHAYNSEAGSSVCGACPHFLDKSCYVEWWRAPLAVWNCWHHGAGYAPATPSDFDGYALRCGSAGDPALYPSTSGVNPLPTAHPTPATPTSGANRSRPGPGASCRPRVTASPTTSTPRPTAGTPFW